MSITLNRTSVPTMTIVSMRGTVPTYSDEGQLWEKMMPLLHQQGIRPTGPCGVIEHDGEYTEHDVDLSVFCPVSEGTTVEAPLELHTLPERDCLVATVRGPYDQISSAHDMINERLTAEGLTLPATDEESLATRAFNLYLNTPGEVGEDELLTQVHQPLA